MSFFSLLNHALDSKGPNDSTLLYQHDLKNAARWGLAGGVALGLYQLGLTLMRRKLHPEVQLIDQQEKLHLDSIIYDAFMQLQAYRKLNVFLFTTALHNTDRLLLLEDVLYQKEVFANKNDPIIAWTYFKMAVNRLKLFQMEVKQQLGKEHAFAVNTLVNKIYSQLQKHLMNILHMCQQFNVSDMIKQADRAIAEAQSRHRAETGMSTSG
jgi:hypothetical protein